jgi:hypothetical protein
MIMIRSKQQGLGKSGYTVSISIITDTIIRLDHEYVLAEREA